MIARILNLPEVEQGIRERAQDAASGFPLGEDHISLPADANVAVAIEADARMSNGAPAGVHLLPSNEQRRLMFIYLAAFGAAMAERYAEAEGMRLAELAAAVKCSRCNIAGAGFPHDPDMSDFITDEAKAELHSFICSHGKEIEAPIECVMDHEEIR